MKINRIIKVLGGIYKIGMIGIVFKVNGVLSSNQINIELDSLNIYGNENEKIKWSSSYYGYDKSRIFDLNSIILGEITEKLKHKGMKKAKYVAPKKIEEKDYEISSNEIIRKDILNKGFELLIVNLAGYIYIGKTLAVINNQEYISRDKGRPFQNPKLSIPPKLARVLINLAGLKSRDTLYDPFCGLGTILLEAAMMGIRVFGSDIDHKSVLGTQENLRWLSQRYDVKIDDISINVFKADAQYTSNLFREKVDGIVTEPFLIPPLKRFPKKEDAIVMLKKSEKLYKKALKKIVKNLRDYGRLVIVTPIIRTVTREEIFLNLENDFTKMGLYPYYPNSMKFNQPFRVSSDISQKVLREVYVLQKLSISNRFNSFSKETHKQRRFSLS